MKGNSPHRSQMTLFQNLEELLNPSEALYKLSNKIAWEELEKEFAPLYSKIGRPSKPVRLMVSLLLLKQIYNLGDETVVSTWVHNPYWQYFSGFTTFQWNFPIDPTDLVHFRNRIGREGLEKIFKISIDLHGKSSLEKEVVIDTTVQEKNITYPTDVKLHKKIIDKCVKIAQSENITLRQSYKRISKQLVIDQRGNRSKNGKAKAKKSARKLRTIAGRLTRELRRKLSKQLLQNYESEIKLFEQVLAQQKGDKNKIYSLHEPKVYCMSKGKAHKRFEFGSKVSITLTKNSGVAVGAYNFEENIYDGHTLPEVLEQTKRLTGKEPKVAIVDRGYRGVSMVGNTEISQYRASGDRTKVGISLNKHLKTCDFGINSICSDINGNIYDPNNGLEDLRNKLIRCVGNPIDRFNEDPLRILRAIRLKLQLGQAFGIEEKTKEAMIKMVKNNKLDELAPERIKDELMKMIKYPQCFQLFS